MVKILITLGILIAALCVIIVFSVILVELDDYLEEHYHNTFQKIKDIATPILLILWVLGTLFVMIYIML